MLLIIGTDVSEAVQLFQKLMWRIEQTLKSWYAYYVKKFGLLPCQALL